MKQDDNRVDAFVFTGDGATSSSPISPSPSRSESDWQIGMKGVRRKGQSHLAEGELVRAATTVARAEAYYTRRKVPEGFPWYFVWSYLK